MFRARGLLVSLLLIVTTACGPGLAQPSGLVSALTALTSPSPGPSASPSPSAAPEAEIHPTGPAQYRALWVDGFHDGFKSPEQVDTLLSRARKANLNSLFVQVRTRGNAYFRRGNEPVATDIGVRDRPHFDPLAYLVQQAHAANPPLAVHAWLNTFFVGQSSEVFKTYGDQWGNQVYGGGNNGYGYLDPGVPAARAYTVDVFMQVVRKYDVDGIHMDFVRYPDGGDWGYSPIALARFNQAFGRSGKPQPDDPAWEQWRRDQVTAFVHDLHDAIGRTRPSVKLSGALIAYGSGPTSDEAWRQTRTYNDVYQDWLTWFEKGYLDVGVPMNYDRESSPSQQGWFRGWTGWEKDHPGIRGKLLVGIGAFLNYPEDTITQIRAALAPSAGGNRPLGVVIYSYASTSVYGTDDFYLAPNDQGYLPRQPYSPSSDPKYLLDRAAQFNDWFYTALAQPSSYQDPGVGRVATTPVFTAPAPLP